MNPEVELIKEMDPEKVAAWDRLHDKRKTYRCHRCGAEWNVSIVPTSSVRLIHATMALIFCVNAAASRL